MSADALLRVGRALQALIEAEPEVGAGKVVLGPPHAAAARLDGPRLGIFLYRIEPCADLRNRERVVRPAIPGEPAEARPGLPLDLRFLVTAFGPEDETGLGAEQLILLGGALRALARGGRLPSGEHPDGQAPRLTIDPLSAEGLRRVWSLFPNTPFQTSVGVLATPVWIDFGAAPPQAAPVMGVRFGYGLKEE